MHQMPPGARPFVVQPGLPAPGERLSHPWCKPCLRAAARERRTGPAQEDFDRLLADQDGRCAICQTVFETGPNPGAGAPRIDRAGDGRVRGLLCARCKIGVSTFQDDADRLRAAVGYLDGTLRR
jgi:hypothetical protein